MTKVKAITKADPGNNSIAIDPFEEHIYANHQKDCIHRIDTFSSQHTKIKCNGYKSDSFYIKMSINALNSDFLLSGSSTGNAYLWNIQNSNVLVIPHDDSHVNAVSFSQVEYGTV
jgi:WD40 repeat protein